MKRSVKNFAAAATATIVAVCVGVAISNSSTSALTYSQDIGVSFTFNPTIRLTLSSANLSIFDLAPGHTSDSNIINVNVITNTANGYTLNASVGNSSTYNTRNLALVGGVGNEGLASVDYGTSYSTLSDVATAAGSSSAWAYAYLDEYNNNTTWSSYSGLPLYSDTTNIATLRTTTTPVTSSTGDNIKFKIGAYATSGQNSGTYNNVINFILVAAPTPTTLYDAFADAGKTKQNGYYKMQDMNSTICSNTEVTGEGSQVQLIDVRDNNVYWVTKLDDGHCWMTQNLDLNIDANATYSSLDTDLTDHSLTGAYSIINGYSYDSTNNIIYWTPERSTIDARNGTIAGWNNTNAYHHPYSMDPGDWYQNGTYFPSGNCFVDSSISYCDYITGSGVYANYFSKTPYSSNGTHGHVGNYYSWAAAIASNDSSTYNQTYGPNGDGSTGTDISYNPQNSICPAGWRLPTQSDTSINEPGSTDEYGRINLLYNNGNSGTGLTNGDAGLLGAPIYFVRNGITLSNSLRYAGAQGFYYTSTTVWETNAGSEAIKFSSAEIDYDNVVALRHNGRALRCVAR